MLANFFKICDNKDHRLLKFTPARSNTGGLAVTTLRKGEHNSLSWT